MPEEPAEGGKFDEPRCRERRRIRACNVGSPTTIAHRVTLHRNFSAGPGALPHEVLLGTQRAILELPGTGVSILGLGHRTPLFRAILDETEERLRRVLALPESVHVLFLQGGGTMQFSMIPMTMLARGGVADYVASGYWSGKAIETARHHGEVRVVWDGAAGGFTELPREGEPLGGDGAAYLHYVSNETVEGLQLRWLPSTRAPLVCDMSSDFLSKPLDVSPFSLVYAHAQKNLGAAGVTIVLVRDEVVARSRAARLPPLLGYDAHADARSIFHTPPVFAIYVVLLTLRWLMDDVGGLEEMGRRSAEKARLVREALAACGGFYRDEVRPAFASDMNVTFRTPSPAIDAGFVARAEAAGFVGIEGHRSRGGLRISLYNGVTVDDARAVAAFLREFAEEAAPVTASTETSTDCASDP